MRIKNWEHFIKVSERIKRDLGAIGLYHFHEGNEELYNRTSEDFKQMFNQDMNEYIFERDENGKLVR